MLLAEVHTPEELRDLLLELIVGAAGGDEAKWRKAFGNVEKLPIALNAQSNWAVHPTGTKAQKAVIEKAGLRARAASIRDSSLTRSIRAGKSLVRDLAHTGSTFS